MTVYVDSSVFLKRYVKESDSDAYGSLLLADPEWVSARHTEVEVRRNLARLLSGPDLEAMRSAFASDWRRASVVELDATVCSRAADLAEMTGARTLDALHLAAAHRVGGGSLPVLTSDLRMAQTARDLGWPVLTT